MPVTTSTVQVRTGTVQANGAELYHEIRGTGPAVLCISGATGDAGHFARLAELLADEFTVVCYDRRGNSRSSIPAGTTASPVEEHAHDAAALLAALGLAPAAVVANSGGAIVALALSIHHPEVVRVAVLDEPPMIAEIPGREQAMAALGPIFEAGMQSGGSPEAVERFLDLASGGAYRQLEPALRQRMLGNGRALFGTELGWETYRPDDATLAGIAVPIEVLAGRDTAPPFAEAAAWLAARLGTRVRALPGAHVPMLTHPEELAATLRPLLRPRP
jgi:pimeloyl-ACP methyl ester carboxylesterase